IEEIEVTVHFRRDGPPRKTLEAIYARFHARLAELPRVVFRRKKLHTNPTSHFPPMPTCPHYSLRTLLLAFLVVSCLLGAIMVLRNCGVSSARTSLIESGMTRSEVVEILGQPQQVVHDYWLYNVWDAS